MASILTSVGVNRWKEMMKAEISSREYASNFYGAAWRSEAQNFHPELANFSQQLDLNPVSLLMSVGQELNELGDGLWQQIIYAGSSLFKILETELQQLGQQLEEQLAALFLREKFGPTGDPIVAQVFAELAQREVLSRQTTKKTGLDSARLMHQAKKQVIEKIKLAIAAEINRIETEFQQYQEAQRASQLFTAQTPAIEEQMREYEAKFKDKFEQLNQEKKRLHSLYQQIDQQFAFVDGRREGQLVFAVAQQSTGPSQIKILPLAA